VGTPDKIHIAYKRRILKGEAISYKGGCCVICGYNRCVEAMEFHHTDEQTKSFSISTRMTSFKAIKDELDKTVLLCANCHREVHAGYHPGYIDYGENYYGDEYEDI
jgi:predicted nucleic acid binding AN1-type Zn finger protein